MQETSVKGHKVLCRQLGTDAPLNNHGLDPWNAGKRGRRNRVYPAFRGMSPQKSGVLLNTGHFLEEMSLFQAMMG